MLLTLILVNLSMFGALIFFYIREKRRFFSFIANNLDPGKPSHIYAVSEVIANQFCQAAMTSFKGTVAGKASGQARAEKGIEGAIVKDMITLADPRMGAVMSMMPSLEKWVNKNPQLAGMAAQKLSGMFATGDNGKAVPDTAAVNSDPFKLQ